MNTSPLVICIVTIALCSETSASPIQEDVRFEVLGSALINKGKRDERIVSINWQRKPQSSDFFNVEWTKITHEATVSANCETLADGGLTNCYINEELPTKPGQDSIYQRALGLLRMQPNSLAQIGKGKPIQVSLLITNPSGTERNSNYCGDPFCTAVPPPPVPRIERGR